MPFNSDPNIFDPNEMAAELGRRGVAWADTKSAFETLEAVTKSILASCKPDTGGVQEKEDIARCSQTFLEHLDNVALAREAFLESQVKYTTFQKYLDLRRSELSTARAEMNNLGGR